MTKTKSVRHYLDKQPELGDKIVIVDANPFGDFTNGQEMTILDISSAFGKYVFAYSPRHGKLVCVSDSDYRIYTDTMYELEGVDIIEKKFLGITYCRREVEKWRKHE